MSIRNKENPPRSDFQFRKGGGGGVWSPSNIRDTARCKLIEGWGLARSTFTREIVSEKSKFSNNFFPFI